MEVFLLWGGCGGWQQGFWGDGGVGVDLGLLFDEVEGAETIPSHKKGLVFDGGWGGGGR